MNINNDKIILKQVKIIAVDLQNNTAEIKAENGCGKCHTKGGCGGNNITKIFCNNDKKNTMKITNKLQAKVGDNVLIGMYKDTLQNSITLAYGLPLFALIFFALLGNIFGEKYSIIFGFLAMFLSFGILKIYNKFFKKNKQNLVENLQENAKPFMIKII